ncbi:helix-turn-helix transcriptional regulator [Symmachiella macrocystis]|uniref:helix-turn-helix transcriptional regulator n=1 Tax=Symmachiella macrocystis TaxID=2527985 RepID=UPI0011B68955|nr:helix-turn-helix domain-containing protein [Symmachiella macrocystis]
MGNLISSQSPPADSPAKLLDVQAVAGLLDCSTRHVYRLSDAGRMPRPIKLGSLVRWPRSVIEQWIADGCPKAARRRQGGDDAK